jgi:oligoendopeptidase F
MIPIRDDNKKVFIYVGDIIYIETSKMHAFDYKLNKNIFYSTIDIICHKNLTIRLQYKDKDIRDKIFDSIYKTLESQSNMIDNSLTKAVDPIMRKNLKFTFYDVCIGGVLYDD